MGDMETGHEPSGELAEAGQALLDAAMAYHNAYRRAGLDGAVVWLRDTAGRLVILTRGEYRDTLMRNIETLRFNAEGEPLHRFD